MLQQTLVNKKTRSWLFTPATRPDRFSKATDSGADVLIVDLEDAVPSGEKVTARGVVSRLIEDTSRRDALPKLAVRINSPQTVVGQDDLGTILALAGAPDFILIPKVESADLIKRVSKQIEDAGKSIQIVGLIESVKGLREVDSIAQSSKRLLGMMFGAADFASDSRSQPDSLTLQLARCSIAMACAEARICAIDAPCFALNDAVTLQSDLVFAQKNGFRAKAAIHPLQIVAINVAYTPSAKRIEWARRVIAASDNGAGVVDGRMVDEAIAREARDVIASI
ncbi:(S)-citramalyl-CoA lyase [Paraburkholderia silvatlantica]|uniref:HpcH/HpaI aldolase/citrate lyase family protein n=2 Tax=cellular organisms TaxID=131567 RepID=W2TZW3_NECAM|nr:HpcH/HpaI aldolase/citrate lyase family protein [Necator americanus]ETN86621.1 HpcH/HpaI aldolase/citrate lyase family protein [Necator americanus]PVY28302.1 (S)-citramalyl-CoA lyase [Paraburkholderia silvatlantica]PXW34987.1 (S)-citramalyl-CoA lyase [Paraburkholderia silvatlantica]TDQ98894.1 (S)-citramalyl-CoA lyase [Paraburkholderia silvatlantica]